MSQSSLYQEAEIRFILDDERIVRDQLNLKTENGVVDVESMGINLSRTGRGRGKNTMRVQGKYTELVEKIFIESKYYENSNDRCYCMQCAEAEQTHFQVSSNFY